MIQIYVSDSLFSAVNNFTEIASKFNDRLQDLDKSKYVLCICFCSRDPWIFKGSAKQHLCHGNVYRNFWLISPLHSNAAYSALPCLSKASFWHWVEASCSTVCLLPANRFLVSYPLIWILRALLRDPSFSQFCVIFLQDPYSIRQLNPIIPRAHLSASWDHYLCSSFPYPAGEITFIQSSKYWGAVSFCNYYTYFRWILHVMLNMDRF